MKVCRIMANKLFRVLKAFSIVIWLFPIFIIKQSWSFHYSVSTILLILGSFFICILFGTISLILTSYLGKEMPIYEVKSIENADTVFLPIYFSFIVLAFSVGTMSQLFIAGFLVFCVLVFARWQFFNPLYLIFGYHCYYVVTNNGVKHIVICKKELKTPKNIQLEHLRRINNTTFIEKERLI